MEQFSTEPIGCISKSLCCAIQNLPSCLLHSPSTASYPCAHISQVSHTQHEENGSDHFIHIYFEIMLLPDYDDSI